MAESSRKQSERRSFGGNEYGCFMVRASETLSPDNAEKLAMFFRLKPADFHRITNAKNPGLCLIQKLDEMSVISEDSIGELVEAMDKIDLRASARDLRKDFLEMKEGEESEVQDSYKNVSKQTTPKPDMYPYLTKEEFESNLKAGIDKLNFLNSFKKDDYEQRMKNYSLKRHRKLEISTHESRNLHIAILGKTGDGKSSTANTILGREAFKTGSSSNSLTTFSCDETSTFRNRSVTVVDTPGVHDTNQDHSTILREIIRWAFLLRGGVHCFIICMNASDPRLKKETKEMLELIKPGDCTSFFNYCMLVYTKPESELSQCSLDEFLETKKDNKSYKGFIDAIDDRVVAVNNTAKIPAEQQRNREAIVAMADKIVKENRERGLNELYTNELIEQAERLHSKIEKIVNENHCHPVLVKAVVESLILYFDDIKELDTFKEKVLEILLQRQDGKLEDQTNSLSFNYNGEKVVISHDIYEKHIRLVCREMKPEYTSFMKLLKLLLKLPITVFAAQVHVLLRNPKVRQSFSPPRHTYESATEERYTKIGD